ncbi:hypothetical protein BDU57DRAFT_572885 [Ampelomyces quisqualis]|uniref:Uncharacterized protein n=1 Tax=Ampelomyces quisqualis TaxID=50730 RepID=A0A6A5Q5S4_AMPQU|nr:hypothetical protein BDU57DRAFT_572885 [Ampelomyces quisqualis]
MPSSNVRKRQRKNDQSSKVNKSFEQPQLNSKTATSKNPLTSIPKSTSNESDERPTTNEDDEIVTRAQQAAKRQAQRDRRAIQQQQGISLPNNNFGLTQQLPQPSVSQPTHLPNAPGPSSSTPTRVPNELPLPTTGAINNPLATQLKQALAVIQALQQQQRLTIATSNRNKPNMKVALSLLQRDKWPRLTSPANYNK